MARFYKGVGVGTYHHSRNVMRDGLDPRSAGATGIDDIIEHIRRGTAISGCISLSRSYGVAEMYALQAGLAFPTAGTKAHVYAIDIEPADGVTVVDPVIELAHRRLQGPFISPSYCHDGDMNFLLGVVEPASMASYRYASVREPPGNPGATPRTPNLTAELEAIVRALRDAEVLVLGSIPSKCVKNYYTVP